MANIKLNAKLSILLLSLLLCGGCTPLTSRDAIQQTGAVDLDGYGNPNFNGIWQAMGAAHWDLEGHAARHGPIASLAALGAVPAGLSVVTMLTGSGR